MSYTSFGEMLRILRIRNHEVMGDMAKVLKVTTPFLSAVENGKKNVPKEWIDVITEHYKLDSLERQKLQDAADESRIQYKVNTANAGIKQRKAAMQFARSFDEMDDETAVKILKLLSKKEGNKNGL